MPTTKVDYIRGASASIQKTINELEQMLEGTKLPKAGKLRKDLRVQVEALLGKVAMEWLKDGFRGGHTIAARRFAETGQFPHSIDAKAKRPFPIQSAGVNVVELSVKSQLSKKSVARLSGDA